MLDDIRGFLRQHSGRDQFFSLIEKIFTPGSSEARLIHRAYETADREFTEVLRDSGDKYMCHLEATALILMYRQRTRNANTISASLLHDIIEDRSGWNRERLAVEFNPTVANIVWTVSKLPDEDRLFQGNKLLRNVHFQRQLLDADLESVRVKLADVLHNAMTIWDSSEEKRKKKIMQTENFYLLLAVRHNILIEELLLALKEMKEEQ